MRPGFSLPVGTVTLLLTDIAGSTRSWESSPDAMSTAVARHYELLDAAITAHNGVRPVEQGEGDSVVGAFARASDAVAAALDAQLALQTEPWPSGAALSVRMAVHTGEAELRDEGNYFGPTMNRAARVKALASGGQVLVSGPTADLVIDRLPEGASLLDLGVHRLKDLGRPERVWVLRHPSLVADVVAPRGLDAMPNNLPAQLTSFVGRRAEMEELGALISMTRLLTLTGVGGCGKTRMALQLAADVVDTFGGGAWFVELAPLTDPDGIVAATALAMGESDLAGDVTEVLVARIGDRPTLLLFDNCEHLLGAVASLADVLLRRCPSLTIVATSREPLGVPGETAWRVPSLSLPSPSSPQPIEALSQFDAVHLFLDRAVRARPNFRLTNENAPAVASICDRLDGIPLAIELAAARVRGLTVEQIAAGLDDRFRLLTGGARTVLPRQQTLQASVDWGYDLLTPAEQAAFRRLSVFAASFTLDAAEQVVAGDDLPAIDVFDLLLVLVDKSMISVDEDAGSYRMLETMRQYGTARLVETGEVAGVRDRHLAWAVAGIPRHDAPMSSNFWREHVAERRVAFEWAMACSRGDEACTLAEALAYYEGNLGDAAEAVSLCERALSCPGASRERQLVLTIRLMSAYLEAGDFKGVLRLRREILTAADEIDDPLLRGRCFAMAAYGGIADARSTDYAERSVEIYRSAGRDDLAHWPASLLAMRVARRGGCAHARAVAATIPDEAILAAVGNRDIALTMVETAMGRFDEAWALTERTNARIMQLRVAALTDARRVMFDLAQGLDRGSHDSLVRDVEDAARRHNGSTFMIVGFALAAWELVRGSTARGLELALEWRSSSPPATHLAWGGETVIVQAQLANGRLDDAGTEIDTFLGIIDQNPLEEARVTHCAALLARLRGDNATAERLWHEILPAQHEHGWRPDLVGTLEGLAGVAAASESVAEASRLAGAAQRLRDEMGYVLRWPAEQRLLDAVLESLDAVAFEEGRALDVDAAVAYATRARGERKRPTIGWESLTPTESEVVELVTRGHTNKEIASALLMGAETVKTHLRHVFDKLGVRTRAALAAAAVERRRLLLDELDERAEDRLGVHEGDGGAA